MIAINNAAYPFAFPLIAALIMLFVQSKSKIQNYVLALGFQAIFLLYSLFLCVKTYNGTIFVTHAGGWLAPFGIALAIDSLSAIMLTFANLIFFLSTFYGFTENSHRFRLPLIFLLQAGVGLSFITADFFNLFVSFEILLTASYALVLLESHHDTQNKAFEYIITNIVGSFLFLAAASIAYGSCGNLNMAALHLSLKSNPQGPFVLALAAASIVIYGLKAGLFPFYFWLPEVYPLLPSSLAGLFGGVLTKVGIYVLIRLFLTILPHSLEQMHFILLVMSGLTMFLGVLGAMSQQFIKKILSYHILSQVGYMTLGIGLFTVNALAAALLFVVHNIVVKSSLFWIGGQAAFISNDEELGKMKGVLASAPVLGICFLLQALSLAGIPPFSGFWGKYLLFSSAIHEKELLVLLVAVVTSFWTLFSMIKIWTKAFWGEKQIAEKAATPLSKSIPIALSVAVSLALGIGIETAYQFSLHASNELFNPALYVQAVLGGRN